MPDSTEHFAQISPEPTREQPTQLGLSDCASRAPKAPTTNGSARRISLV
jgi:hypothetical protein